jgi:hypothetical protein
LGAYHYLRGKVDRLLHEMEAITLELLSSAAFVGWESAEGNPHEISQEERGRL